MTVEFDGDERMPISRIIASSQNPRRGLIQFMINRGWVSDEKQGAIALAVFCVIIILVSIFIVYLNLYRGNTKPPTREEFRKFYLPHE